MRRIKLRLLPLVFALAVPGAATAAARNPMTVVPAAGSEKRAYQLQDVAKISFADGSMLVHSLSGSVDAVPLEEIEKIVFDAELDAIGESAANFGALTVSLSGRVVTARMSDGAMVSVTVSDTAGRVVFSGQQAGCCSVDLGRFPQGVYIVKANDKVIKVK